MFLLDTNVVSELRKARQGRADPGVITWSGSVNAKTLYLSAISLMELETGVLGIERKDAAQGTLLRTWLNQQVLPGFAGRVLAVDATVALACARLHVPDRKSERDALIAATALVHGLTVVTRNLADFEGTGVPLINPWSQG
ncbi:twitching motility protein PilT [Pseudomonas sp. Pc102]|uniref:type II toxin-antitoxin system VapC family toxin n=1 Tax=Pseudomonas sp. Pc102 TaxID=2678261 RepID=UPI001BCAC7A4|nr:type II toxin-antitoxin system VapC family toxin [Pseudomonas sp. Pc102]BBP85281.1 twitching motility protein PilT [Pseudomonas sp. Pc102]